MRERQRTARPLPAERSIAVVDDASFIRRSDGIQSYRGDFCRFSLRLGKRAGRHIIFCSPVIGEKKRRVARRAVLGEQAELVTTFPYTRVAEYMRKLPLALLWNVRALTPVICSSDLVLIRLPAASGPLAFVLASILRKPIILFVVGSPAVGALARYRNRALRAGIRLAARLEWGVIAKMARRAPVFAYGRDLARQLEICGARRVAVTFTSLIEHVSGSAALNNWASSRITLLFAGRFVPEKGIDVLLDAAALCAGSDCSSPRVVLVGDGPLASDLRHHAASIECLDVEFLGWLDDGPELDKVFGEADIFVQPSRADGIPKVLLKAMAYGLPIVATNVGGIPDIVKDGDRGLLVPPDDACTMSDALLRLTFDPELRRRLGGRGRDFAREHTADRQADAIWQQIVAYYPSLTRPAEG